MAKRPTLTDVTSLTNSSNINAINQNWDAIQEAFDNTLSLDGSTPNAMNSDLDLNGNSLLNVDTLDVDGLTLNGQTVTGLATVPEWRGPWASGQGYVVNDLVKTAGNVYICLVAHTAGGDFSTDLTAGNWELFVSKGDSGAGTGDMLSTNNLSDVDNPATSRTNLGLGIVAVENTVPVAKGGTGATDATTARTNLSAQTLNANLTSLSGITLAQGDLLYASGPDTFVRLPKGAANQVLQMNTGATAPEWVGGIGTSQSTTSGTEFDFIGIPENARRIIVLFDGVSLSNTDNFLVQVGSSGGFVTTGYVSSSGVTATSGANAVRVSNGFVIIGLDSTNILNGFLEIIKGSSNNWYASHAIAAATNQNRTAFGGGSISLGAALDRVRLTRSGTNTFDAGSVNVMWE